MAKNNYGFIQKNTDSPIMSVKYFASAGHTTGQITADYSWLRQNLTF